MGTFFSFCRICLELHVIILHWNCDRRNTHTINHARTGPHTRSNEPLTSRVRARVMWAPATCLVWEPQTLLLPSEHKKSALPPESLSSHNFLCSVWNCILFFFFEFFLTCDCTHVTGYDKLQSAWCTKCFALPSAWNLGPSIKAPSYPYFTKQVILFPR